MIYDWDGRLSRRKVLIRMTISAALTMLVALALGALVMQVH